MEARENKVQKVNKTISKGERHLRWNWERSPDNEELVRYHFVIVDDRDREGIMNRILEPIFLLGHSAELIRNYEGKVKKSKFRYLFGSYDAPTSPSFLKLYELGKPVKRDQDLRERKVGAIEDYVIRIYEE